MQRTEMDYMCYLLSLLFVIDISIGSWNVMVYDLPDSMKLCIVYECVDWYQHCTQHKYDTYNLLKDLTQSISLSVLH